MNTTTRPGRPDDDLTDDSSNGPPAPACAPQRDAGYCEVCHHELQPGDLCPTCERADEGLL